MYDSFLREVGAASRHQIFTLLLCNCVTFYSSLVTFSPVLGTFKRPYSCIEHTGSLPLATNSCDSFNGNVTCLKWEFSNITMHSTIISQYELTCDKEYLVQLSVTIYFIGILIGCPLFGKASDLWGRHTMMIILGSFLVPANLVLPFLPYFWLYCIFRFGIGSLVGGLGVITFTLNSESVDEKHRLAFSIFINNGWSVGIIVFAVIGYFVRDHFWLHLASCIISSPFMIAPLPLLKESGRWLLETGRYKRFRSVAKRIAKLNRRPMPSNDWFCDLQTENEKILASKVSQGEMNFSVIWRYPHLRTVAVIHWCGWLLVSCGYYASSLGVGLLGGNIFLSLGLNGLIEFPGRLLALYFSTRFGRVIIISVGFILGGIFFVISTFLMEQPNLNWLLITVSLIGKYFFVEAFELIWSYSAEIYPTQIRNNGIGLGSMWARVGATISPLLLMLYSVRPWAPSLLLGVVSVVVGCATLLTPETKGKSLPVSLEEADKMCKISVLRLLLKKLQMKNAEQTKTVQLIDADDVRNCDC